MVGQLKKYFLWLLLLVPLGVQGKQNPTHAVAAAIRAAQRKAPFRSATIGCYAVNYTKNKVIGEFNAAQSIIPASTLKLLTTAAAPETLGKDFRFKTTLQYDGEIDEQGTLQGNIYIQGGGDPALGSQHFQDHYYQPHFIDTWVQAIQAKGIKKVAGAVIGDAQIYTDLVIPATWVVDDLGQCYGAGVSGLSVFDNTYTITLQAAEKEKEASLIDITPPLPEEVQIISQVKGAAIDHQQVQISGFPDHLVRVLQGTIPCGVPTILQSTSPDPAYWASYTLHHALQKQGVEVTQPPTTVHRNNPPPTARQALYTMFSPPLSELIRVINHNSLNSYAEHLLKHLSLAAAGLGTTPSGTQALKQFWAAQGIDVTGMLLYDGSGLSRYNALTPKQLVGALCHMKTSANFAAFYASLPIAGKTGNLACMFKQGPLTGRLRAKSGHLSHVRGFAGYCTNQAGDEIAFALIVNHYDGPRSSAEKALEKILRVLVQQK